MSTVKVNTAPFYNLPEINGLASAPVWVSNSLKVFSQSVGVLLDTNLKPGNNLPLATEVPGLTSPGVLLPPPGGATAHTHCLPLEAC